MIKTSTKLSRVVAIVLSFTLPASNVPLWAMTLPSEGAVQAPAEPLAEPSRKLTVSECNNLKGRLMGQNPYVAGTNKWSVVHNGIDLITGNFTTSATDLSFEGGYGIPVNFTRSYSANNPDEGPLGVGWTMSVDIRSTAGGLLKSSSAPVRSIPVNFKERPAGQDDPGVPTEPAEAVVSTDAAGKETTIQRDVDGVLTTPAWEKNEIESEYELVTVGSDTYEVLLRNVLVTPEGTTYEYEKKGYYVDPPIAYNQSSGSTAPSNILKITQVTDRHGNETNYYYNEELGPINNPSTATFAKYNGSVIEDTLDYIQMPGGRGLTFGWGTGSTGQPTDRIVHIEDTAGRDVYFTYTAQGQLATSTTPGGKVTSYTYGAPAGPSTVVTAHDPIGVLTSITDPRGLVTQIEYWLCDDVPVLPYDVGVTAVTVHRVILPNGIHSYFQNLSTQGQPSTYPTLYLGNLGLRFVDLVLENSQWKYIQGGNITWGGSGTDAFVVTGYGVGGIIPAPHPESPMWEKTYDLQSWNLDKEVRHWPNSQFSQLASDRQLNPSILLGGQKVVTETDSNFMGAPLKKTVKEYHIATDNAFGNPIRTQTTEYGYWGADKYYQQKIVKDPVGRYTFTDYYDDQATTGKKGQTYRVYSADVFGTPYNDTSVSIPTGTASGDEWKYRYFPEDLGKYSAQFDYDSKGRPIDVWKLQAKTSPNWTYVQTHTTYNSDGSGLWGLPNNVVEAYGTSIARTTTTSAYDPVGRATEVLDAQGREFTTVYNSDGQVVSITRTDGSNNIPIVSYSYGTSSVENGMVTSVTDELSDIKQTISYSNANDASKGQVTSVAEANWISNSWTNIYTTTYTYNNLGLRETALYETPHSADAKWEYRDYTPVGFTGERQQVFQTLTKLAYVSGNWVRTPEEFHYAFDPIGRLQSAAYAQTTNASSAPYYGTGSLLPLRRIVTKNTYDPGGRILTTATSSQTNTSGTLTHVGYFFEEENDYSNTLGLKEGSEKTHYNASGGTPSGFTSWTELYQYGSTTDYLTGASYNNGSSYRTWAYDAAGNRTSDSGNSGTWSYDLLNRMTASPGMSYTHDTVGNRIGRNYVPGNTPQQQSSNARLYKWDDLNRMTATAGTTAGSGARYVYRADGMRTQKVTDLSLEWVEDGASDDGSGWWDENTSINHPTTRYYYDGQMPIEEDFADDVMQPEIHTTKYGLGARGVDYIEKWIDSSLVGCQFPVYDGHGNMVMTLNRTSTAFADANHRRYDVWGSVMTQASVDSFGGPNKKYVANLGHVEDEESSLQYMRARYYEPWTGRFLSEDPIGHGSNWFIYCGNRPSLAVDPEGTTPVTTFMWSVYGLVSTVAGFAAIIEGSLIKIWASSATAKVVLATGLVFLSLWFTAFSEHNFGDMGDRTTVVAGGIGFMSMLGSLSMAATASELSKGTLAREAVGGITAYMAIITLFMALDQVDDSWHNMQGS